MTEKKPSSGQPEDAISNGGLRPQALGDTPVDDKGATIPPPDQRRSDS